MSGLSRLQQLIQELAEPHPERKVVLLVLDGLGDLPVGNQTPLQAARTPNLDALARERAVLGQTVPIAAGITPGSGPAHLALFGYDPVAWRIGRGVLEAAGIDFPLEPQDVAARGNFCTLDAEGRILDRRAGRPPTSETVRICRKLQEAIPEIDGVQVFVRPVKEHRFVVVFRGEGLEGEVADTDPQVVGEKPLPARPLRPEAARTAEIANRFVERALRVLADEKEINGVLLRGFARRPQIPSMQEVYRVNPAVLAVYPMYRGLARLVGMEALEAGGSVAEAFSALEANWERFDFFFLHVKGTDSAGEDGDFLRKVQVIEAVDAQIPRLLALKPAAFVVTGDHSTPVPWRAHSWHPVPWMLVADTVRPDRAEAFHEAACARGGLGRFPAEETVPWLLAHAGRLRKFGA